jgi:exopolysaccharide production protein ExoQ
VIALIAAIGTALASAMLLRLDRDSVRISKAVWIPLAWLTIASSRPVSNWLTFGAPAEVSNQYIDGSPLDRNVLTLLLALAIAVLFQRSGQVKAILRSNAPLVIFLVYCGISMLWADYPLVLLKRWIRAVGDVAMVCVILTEAHPQNALKRVLMLMGAFLLPLSILFTRFFPSLGRSYTYSGVPMWTGVATDKNALGALCMIAGVLLLSRGLTVSSSSDQRYRGRRLFVIGLLFAMAVYLLAMVDSKTALACFVMASSLILMRMFPSAFRKPWLLTTMVVSMIALSYSILFLGVGSHAISEMGRDTSLTGRTQVWDIVIPFAVNPWIGAGYENFWIGERLTAIVRAVGAGLNQAHNGYIEIYLNIGWVGLLLLGAVIIYGYRNIMRGLREDPEMSGLKLAFFFICLVYNFTEAAFKIMSPVWITFLWATIAVPMARVSATTQAPAAPQVPVLSDWTRVLSEVDTPNRAGFSG